MHTLSPGLEACPIGTMEMNSQNFAGKRILFKVFRPNSNEIVSSFQHYLNFPNRSELLTAKKTKFLMKFGMSDNCLRSQFDATAITDLQPLIYLIFNQSINQIFIHKARNIRNIVEYVQCTCNYLFQFYNYCA